MKFTQHLSIQSVLLLVLLLLHISPSQSKLPPASSAGAAPSTSTSSPSLLSPDERTRIYNEAYDQAVFESDLLEDEDDEDDQKAEPQVPDADVLDEEVLDLEGADMESFVEGGVEAPAKLQLPSTPLTSSSFPILGDPRRAVETALTEQLSVEHANELRAALTRIRTRGGWPTAAELERFVIRIRAWQDVLLAELDAQGTLPEFARLFIQPAERYVAPVLSQYAWPPLYALKRGDEYTEEFRFGDGGTLSERMVDRMAELNSPSIIGNVDVSYLAFPGSCTGRHPLTRYLSSEQRAALNRFHLRIYQELLLYPRVIVMNGGDVNTDLLVPLIEEGVFEVENVFLRPRLCNIWARFDFGFIRLPGTNRDSSSLLLRRRHPQALSDKSTPTLKMQLRADTASELIRGLAHRGEDLPAHNAFLNVFSRSTFVTPGDTNEPLEPTRVPLEYRLAHLARVERGMRQPFTLEQLKLIDHYLAQAVREVLQRLPVPTTNAIPCPPHIAGSPLQQARQRLLVCASKTRTRTYSIRRKVRFQVTLTSDEKKLLVQADIRKANAAKAALEHPERAERWKIVRRDQKRNRSEAERARALEQDQASYRRRREEMSAQEREARLAEQSLRSNVRNLDVVSPLDFLSSLAAPPLAPVNADSSLVCPIASSSNALLPVVGSSSNTFLAPAFQPPSSNFSSSASNSQSLSGKSRPKPPPVPPHKPDSSKQRGKGSKYKKVVEEVEKEEEGEEEEAPEPAPSGKGKGVKRKKDDDASMRKRGW